MVMPSPLAAVVYACSSLLARQVAVTLLHCAGICPLLLMLLLCAGTLDGRDACHVPPCSSTDANSPTAYCLLPWSAEIAR
jgi:hypothetical protein